MDLFLKDKVVIVTGGGSGIGAAVTQLLAEEGAVPVIVTNAQPEQGFMDRLKQIAPQSELIIADLCQEAECARAVSQVLARFGRIDALVNNAGVNDGVGLEAGREAFLGSLDPLLSDGPPMPRSVRGGAGGYRQYRLENRAQRPGRHQRLYRGERGGAGINP